MRDIRIPRRILLTNDDGIDAPGLAVLEEIARSFTDDVWVVAPSQDRSGISHALSLHDPLRIRQLGPRRFSVTGTPGDCVAIAVRQILRESSPDLLLSGVNQGANLGVETFFSGTVGAAMTAKLLGIPAMALSQAFADRSSVPWATSRGLAPDVLSRLLPFMDEEPSCLNVNFPAIAPEHVRGVRLTEQGQGKLTDVAVLEREDARGLAYSWLTLVHDASSDRPGTETHALAQGCISVTPLSFGRTDETLRRRIESGFGQDVRA
ncbi:5'/3'-nucleotidase SurE [Swaminathania salitolerans]|uniref:5'-nucleotidase SurE n=1 Tax=Swaminathania salitolerans TaxID=182838 RepID=A0A511BYT6_9PROT|nr:5'/3'-nucleotidase SurE [Swaminathania salitolerans]GBQ12817.1 exopolyphosphatase [Swaminathania salitolerans LMG 21291]GEL03178.1 5'-nucleotidase SurE [Swaminathania salitolerans]